MPARIAPTSLLFRSRWLALLLLAASLAGCLADTPAAAPTARPRATAAPTARPRATATPLPPAVATPAAQAEWTVLVYLDGDNDLEPDAIDDYAEMASVGSSSALNIVVQFDRIASDEDWDDTSNGDWRGVKRFRVERDKRPTKSNQLADLGELDMGDPRTLADFVAWGISSYPARHYALIFWDHGAAWPGVASDDSSDGDMLTLPELACALADVRQRTGVQKFDLIGFDACLMGQIDVLQAIAPFGQVAVGSADLEPGEGWAWNAWLGALANNPQQSAAALAPSIIKSFAAFYKKEKDPSVTLAAFDLGKVEQMTSQLDTLAGALIAALPRSYAAIGKARAHAAEYASGDADISAIDLGYFADALAGTKAAPDIANAARALRATINTAQIAYGYGADHSESTGLSVYFPWKKKHYDASYSQASPLTRTTRWDEFLQAFYKAGRASSARSLVAPLQLSQATAAPDAPLALATTIGGDDTAQVYYFVGRPDPAAANRIRVLVRDYIYPPGASTNGAIPAWRDGDSVQLSWRASSWYLANGRDVVLAPFAPVEYGSNSYSVAGSYVSRKTGKRTPASLEFDVAQGRGTLTHIWAFDKAGGTNPRPRELKARAGDSFLPSIPIYDENDPEAEGKVDGAPITFGAEPLSAFSAEAPAGEYVVGLMVESIAGATHDQYADVTVANPRGAATPPIPAAPAAAASGAAPDTLRYYDDQLGARIDYPATWQVASSSADRVVLASPDDAPEAYASVDAYALEGTLAAANKAMLAALLDADARAPGFARRQAPTPARVAGHAALRTEYVYQDKNGVLFHVLGVAVSDKPADATYLITFEAPESSFAASAALFEQMLGSFAID